MTSTKYQTNSNNQIGDPKAPHPLPLPLGERGRVRGSFEIRIWKLGFNERSNVMSLG